MSPGLEIQLGAVPTSYAGGDATRVFGVIGHPVAHSLSPAMHNAALGAARVDATYLAFDVAPAELGDCMARLRLEARRGRVGGVNVTLPHKQAVIAELDGLDATAALAGAVNTVRVQRSGGDASGDDVFVRLLGFNTDVDGLVAALADCGVRLAGARLVVLGAGGMARAAVVAALREGVAEIRVANRTVPRAREMLDAVCGAWRGRLPSVACTALADAPGLIADAHLLVQATSLGLQPDDPSPMSLVTAAPDLFVLDAVYNPPESALLRQARALGLRRANGLGMLVHQGAAALRLWTGIAPALEVMRRSLGL